MTGAEVTSIMPNNDVDSRKSAEEMDEQRHKTLVYEYLCHLEEAKKWIEACLREELPPTTELEENFRNGVYLAKLAHFMNPQIMPLSKIYDPEQRRYAVAGLQFKHTENIHHFLTCLRSMQLPLTFQPETTDIYDKKNMPRLIYCIHALSTHLFKLGRAPQIQDLYGKVEFTDAEIDAVSKELKKFGIEIPAFQKIGGLLTNSMAGDTAALHAAVIAINQTLSCWNLAAMTDALQNPSARLENVRPELADKYFVALSDAKELKTQAALNRSLNDSYVPDAYDELLTSAEIQGHISNINVLSVLQKLSLSICNNAANLFRLLDDPALQLRRVSPHNVDQYRVALAQFLQYSDNFTNNPQHWLQVLQKRIDEANNEMQHANQVREAVRAVNAALDRESPKMLQDALLNPLLGISHYIDSFALPLYYEEMKIDHAESKTEMTHDDIRNSTRVLTCIAFVTKAVEIGNPEIVWEALQNPETQVAHLDEGNKIKYFRALQAARQQKNSTACSLLTYMDIQDAIDVVNEQCTNDDLAIDVLHQLNQAVARDDRAGVMKALQSKSLGMKTPTTHQDASLYLCKLKRRLSEKTAEGAELWLDDIEEVARDVAGDVDQVKWACMLLAQINRSLDDADMLMAVKYLRESGVKIVEKYAEKYFNRLLALKEQKQAHYHCKYFRYVTPWGTESFIDLETLNYTWDRPENIGETHFVTKEDIETVVKTIITEEQNFSLDDIDKEVICSFQACARGYLFRKRLEERLTHYCKNVEKIVKIQSWWRGQLQRRKFVEMTKKRRHVEKKNRRIYDIDEYYARHIHKIVMIQAFWRGRLARRAFLSLLRMEQPPFSVVRHFSTILDFNTEDYNKDLQLQQLKFDVVQAIKSNRNLSQQLDNMDIKIGLLIQNRITLQDVIAHGKNLETLAKEKNNPRLRKTSTGDGPNSHKGLKSLTKEGRKMLEGYQHFFYALQTNPTYLSKLLFLLPHNKSNKFVQNVILSLFNYGSNTREEYLLLKLLGCALREEILSKFQRPSEVVAGNPLVLKMAVNYARQLHGQRALRQILGPVIEMVLTDKSISIETNPVDIYKSWRNQQEMETGETSRLPYTVTHQQALEYDEVRKRLARGIEVLRRTVVKFLDRITESRDLIPYGMLYISRVLHDTLMEKFPQALEKDILKVVGNFIYYHFINAAIVAPDAFEIVSLPVDRSLSNDQRRNLASIAKILQFAASKKGFGEESTHLLSLNQFIIECHERFKEFFRSCCQIEALEDHFSMHQYTEATLIHKPEIYISIEEICNTQMVVSEYEYDIAPDPSDPLHILLDDLEANPTVTTLMGVAEPVCETVSARMAKSEVCLVLTNKFEVPDSGDQNLQKLFIKTKELLVSMLRYLKGESLIEALECVSSPIQEQAFNITSTSMMLSADMFHLQSASLNECKLQLRTYLQKLEAGGWVSRSDGYQSIVTAVANDLCNKGKYRTLRNKELQTLRATRQRLQEKTKYYAEQVEYYNEYIQRCLENLHTGRGSLRAFKIMQKNSHRNLKSKTTLKYSAARLCEKGILLEIDGLPSSQFKNVIFEITPTEHTGLFTIKGKFMGVEVEKIDIAIQKLLELQFEGATIMDLFGKAKINVNLLLFLLNRKFYGKT